VPFASPGLASLASGPESTTAPPSSPGEPELELEPLELPEELPELPPLALPDVDPLALPEEEPLPELLPPDEPLDDDTQVSGARYESGLMNASGAPPLSAPAPLPPLPLLPLPPLLVCGGSVPGGSCWGFRLHAYDPAKATM
jgi:hypothetical protein